MLQPNNEELYTTKRVVAVAVTSQGWSFARNKRLWLREFCFFKGSLITRLSRTWRFDCVGLFWDDALLASDIGQKHSHVYVIQFGRSGDIRSGIRHRAARTCVGVKLPTDDPQFGILRFRWCLESVWQIRRVNLIS